jgi:hypothetical protein
MPRKSYKKPEEIVTKLRQVDVLGLTGPERGRGASGQTSLSGTRIGTQYGKRGSECCPVMGRKILIIIGKSWLRGHATGLICY